MTRGRPRRRAALSAGAGARLVAFGVGAVAILVAGSAGIAVPVDPDQAVNVVQICAVYIGFVLTAESVIFSIVFAETGEWPGWAEVASRSLFLATILVAGLSAVATALALALVPGPAWPRLLASWITHDGRATVAFLWLATALMGTVSFVLLSNLAAARGRNRYLAGRLSTSLRRLAVTGGDIHELLEHDPTIAAHNDAIERALAEGRSGAILDLVDQIRSANARGWNGGVAGIAYAYQASRKVLRSLAVSGSDGLIASRTLTRLAGPSALSEDPDAVAAPGGTTMRAFGLILASRFTGWLWSAAAGLAERGELSVGVARLLQQTARDIRRAVIRDVDPFPDGAPSARPTSIRTALDAVGWYQAYSAHSAPGSNVAAYTLYSLATGMPYHGDYMEGQSPLSDVCSAVYNPTTALSPVGEDIRREFPERGDLEAALTLSGAERLTRGPVPGLDTSTLAAEFLIIGSIGELASASEALDRLAAALTSGDRPWAIRLRELRAASGRMLGRDPVEVTDNLASLALAVALALEHSSSPAEVARYWSCLSPETRTAADELLDELIADAVPAGDAPSASAERGFALLDIVLRKEARSFPA